MKEVSGGNPLTHHTRWKNLVKMEYSNDNVSEHAMLCKMLLWALTYDQLNCANLACMELLVRRIQMIEHKLRTHMADASIDGLGQEDKLYLGSEIAKGTICFSPKLREYMALKIGEDAKMMKGQRLAREERALLGKKKK